jgi:hypothetical protein
LLHVYVSHARVFWREEIARLKHQYKPAPHSTRRQKTTWQAGFLFWDEKRIGFEESNHART